MAKKPDISFPPNIFPIDFFGMEELGRAIKQVRKLRGITQKELSMRTNTSEKFISNVENGKETAQLGKVLLLIRILDMGTRLIDLRAEAEKG
jgi:transcriptional regulator with XRE-family HTH domain